MYIANHVYPAAFVTVGFGARYNSLLLFEPAPNKMVHVTSLFFVLLHRVQPIMFSIFH